MWLEQTTRIAHSRSSFKFERGGIRHIPSTAISRLPSQVVISGTYISEAVSHQHFRLRGSELQYLYRTMHVCGGHERGHIVQNQFREGNVLKEVAIRGENMYGRWWRRSDGDIRVRCVFQGVCHFGQIMDPVDGQDQ